MADYKGIYVKNVFYMLAYAFGFLDQRLFQELSSEDFHDVDNLLSVMLFKGVGYQLKAGLYRGYVNVDENISSLRGSLNIQGEIRNKSAFRQKLACNFDELSENNIDNQILKTTIQVLLKNPDLKEANRSQLKNILRFFSEIDSLSPVTIPWSTLKFSKNNCNYRILLNICRLILKDYLPATSKGKIKTADYIDEKQMASIYEKFILEYYRFHHHEANASPLCISWNLDRQESHDDFSLLPKMKTDITMEVQDKTLIIDAKFYGHMLQRQDIFDSATYHSGNMYQIFAYVKNKDVNNMGKVSGMLLYAKTHEDDFKEGQYLISGNKISVIALDLDQPFELIREKLESIYKCYFQR